MDQMSLVMDRIGAGEHLLNHLRDSGFPVDVAFWTEDVEDGYWRFFVATPDADRRGKKPAYRSILDSIRRLPSWRNRDIFALKVIGTADPMAKVISGYADRFVGNALHAAGRIQVGDIDLGPTYIYPKTP